ncbi:MAG TPA: folylpolyglutamate synthase/dihydrofolate synthase family protein [Cyclobacteriaceae bacterium]|nr:folylpolyglutamate synthase/dihydrofolate synthase family protein [Cyclobacteriaceae bacterium]
MFTGYQQAIDYLYANLPIFQRVGAIAYKIDLTNTLKLCEAVGNPQLKFKSIHVAGTNGKGSTSHMLASVLQSSDYKTGLYTSPHLKDFTERIKINGQQVDRDFVVKFVNKIKPSIEIIKPSFFEITVVMAFDYFAQEKVDVAVIEVGLGGRLDSTNVITPEVSVITNISFDHKDLLGDTLEKIAFEKAGIIKPGVPVVVSERQHEVEQVFVKKASECKSEIHFAQDNYYVEQGAKGLHVFLNKASFISELELPLKGIYQAKNLTGVLKTVDILRQKGFNISKKNLEEGLQKSVQQTGLKGRWQQLGEKPMMYCDTGHNYAGVQEVVKQISLQKFKKLHIVWGMVKDKDPDDILALLPKDATYYFCQANIPRALEAKLLNEKAAVLGLRGQAIPDVNAAIKAAKKTAGPDDFIFIGGSTFVVAEIDSL